MKRAFTLLELVIVVAIILVVAAFLFPVFTPHHPGVSKRAQCHSNLKQIGLGFIMYTQDYNDVFPATGMGTSSGWANAIEPYVKDWSLYQCPSTKNQAPSSTDYSFNARLSRGYAPNISSPPQTILSVEGYDDAPTWAQLRQLPRQWLKNRTTPLWRHLDSANYLFADGHVKSLKTSAISTQSPDKTAFTFAVR